MQIRIKTSFTFYLLTLFVCLNSFFLWDSTAQTNNGSASGSYTFETIDVPGVDFLALTASNDFEDYAGYTKSEDGEKEVAFTFIDSVFTTYDFPGAENTYFFALGNDNRAAGYYEDSNGLHHGVVLEDGELRQQDFPGSVQTEIYGISDETGVLTGNFVDASGVRRGFTGDGIIEYPGATATFAYFTTGRTVIGSYIDAEGVYHGYVRIGDGRFVSIDLADEANLEFLIAPSANDAGLGIFIAKAVGDVPRTFVGTIGSLAEFRFPDSVSTAGWNINQDSSVVGYYDSADGGRHGFIARPVEEVDDVPVVEGNVFNYSFESIDVPGVNFLALTASSDFEDYAGSTPSDDGERMVGFTLIDGVFQTHEFPDAKNTFFYALSNKGIAAGHYEDSDGLYHGVILEDGEMRRYDFPGAKQTFIHGLSDATGNLTGNFIDANGVRRGFTGDEIIEYPGASATYAEFVNADGLVVGSYVDADGVWHAFGRTADGRYITVDLPGGAAVEYFSYHGISDDRLAVARGKAVGDVPRTYVGRVTLHEVKFPGSVSTEGWNINQDGSIVGHYESADGRVRGFIARLIMNEDEPVVKPPLASNYVFESIDVPGVDFLSLTVSNDLGHYAGYTLSPNGEKEVGFTLIDGVFKTYDFPGSQNTYFYALGNDGTTAGHSKDSDGLYHGVVLENGELRRYDFPGAVQTAIYGISDTTGALTGNFLDASGVLRGYSGNTIVEVPGATGTYAFFTSTSGAVIGSYVDSDGIFHGYVRAPDGRFIFANVADVLEVSNLEYLFSCGINDVGVGVAIAQAEGDVPRTYVGGFEELQELRVPGSVSTEGWHINQDASVVGHYDSPDGRRHGFIARLATEAESDRFGNVYNVTLAKGLNMLSVPLAPINPMNAKSLAGLTGATTVITLDAANQRFIGWTPSAPNDGFAIEGGQGYIVNVPENRNFAFVGAPWTNQTDAVAAAPAIAAAHAQEAWAFVVSGHLEGVPTFDGYRVIVRNTRTGSTMTASVQGNYFAAATADLSRRSVVEVGDVVEVHVIGPGGNVESHTLNYRVTPEHLADAVMSVRLDAVGQPKLTRLLQNYPNPFNPETWIPYQLSEDSLISVSIYDTTGKLIRSLPLGFQSAGFYNSQERSAYWDGRNDNGESVASGVYFYQLEGVDYTDLRRMVILK